MESIRTKEELPTNVSSRKRSWEIQMAKGLWEERESQSPFFLSSGRLDIAAGNLDFGKMLQIWIVLAHYSIYP